MTPRFRDRFDAGRRLAQALESYRGHGDLLVLALPRGGVPIGFEVAKALGAPLDIMIVRKLGVPGQEELALGAIASGGIRILSEDVIAALQIPGRVIATVAATEETELKRRERAYREDQPAAQVRNHTVILVDDGLATGSTIRAAAQALRQQDPARIVVAVPVSAPQTCDEYRIGVDEIVCAVTPEPLYGVGQWYDDFSQTTDEEVRDLLERARNEQSMAHSH